MAPRCETNSSSTSAQRPSSAHLVADAIECKGGVVCQGVVVLDPANPQQRLVELGQGQPAEQAPGQPERRFGVLVFKDDSGQVLFGVANNALYVRQVNCEGVRVVDPEEENRTLAGLGSVAVNGPDGKPRRFGVLALNNDQFGTLTGNPPRDVLPEKPKQQGQQQEKNDEAPATDATTPNAAAPSSETPDAA